MAEAEKKTRSSVADKKLRTKFKGKSRRKCRFCGSAKGLIRKYDLYVCRRCFREVGEGIGFRKY